MIARNSSGREVASTIRNPEGEAEILREFRTAYADALDPEITHEAWARASKKRRLVWRHPQRVSLETAAHLYGELAVYNGFRPSMVKALHKAFARDRITVTVGRDYSVVVYLHVPDRKALRKRVESFVRGQLRPDELSWEDDGTLRLWWD